jgi:hypothetical protein
MIYSVYVTILNKTQIPQIINQEVFVVILIYKHSLTEWVINDAEMNVSPHNLIKAEAYEWVDLFHGVVAGGKGAYTQLPKA